MQTTTRLMARIKGILKQLEKQDLPPELLGIHFDNNEGAIDDGVTYNTYEKPMNDWQKSEQETGWVTSTRFNDKP